MRNSIKNKRLSCPALCDTARRIFSLTQSFPVNVLSLLMEKRVRKLLQKQEREIYETLRQRNLFPIIVNAKTLMEFCEQLVIELYEVNQNIYGSEICYVVVDGAVKIYQEEIVEKNQQEEQPVALNGGSQQQEQQPMKNLIEKRKLMAGDVLVFQQKGLYTEYVATVPVLLLRIPQQTYVSYTYSNFLTELKKKQDFFSKIPLFERHYRSSLEDFVNSLEETQYAFNQKVFSEGDKIAKVYIVKQGEFLLEKNISSDGFIIKNRQIRRKQPEDSADQQNFQKSIRVTTKHFRTLPYKIIGPKQILGGYEHASNYQFYMHSMRCHKQGSILYSIDANLFLAKLYVAQSSPDNINTIMVQKFQKRKKQIEAKVKFNQSNQTILKILPNSTSRLKSFYSNKRSKTIVEAEFGFQHKADPKFLSTCRTSTEFFQKMNKTIINLDQLSIRKRKLSKSPSAKCVQKSRLIFKTPAVVQEIVHIVNQKKAYHKLRNLNIQRKGCFKFDINNVPPFIKKKYGRLNTSPSEDKKKG